MATDQTGVSLRSRCRARAVPPGLSHAPPPSSQHRLKRPDWAPRGSAIALTIASCSLIAALSTLPGWSDLLFPELGPLAAVVFSRPGGPWASQGWRLIAVPTAAAVIGLWISVHQVPHGLALLLAVAGAQLLLWLLRSPLAPALSAAALPVVLGLRSWTYPLQIALGLSVLTAVLAIARRRLPPEPLVSPPSPQARPARAPSRWWLPWFGYLLLLTALVELSGWRVLLLPPLIVISHERFAEFQHCPWLGRAWLLPIACSLAAVVGVLSARWLAPHAALAVALSLLLNLALMHRLRLWLPPLLAVGLLPLLMPHADWRYVAGVGVAASILAFTDRHERRPDRSILARLDADAPRP